MTLTRNLNSTVDEFNDDGDVIRYGDDGEKVGDSDGDGENGDSDGDGENGDSDGVGDGAGVRVGDGESKNGGEKNLPGSGPFFTNIIHDQSTLSTVLQPSQNEKDGHH